MKIDNIGELNRRILTAHGSGDTASLVSLYSEAANLAEADGDVDRAAFFLTHAWIFALDRGDETAEALAARLRGMGRLDEGQAR